MPCTISAGRALGCRDNAGGVREIYIGNFATSQGYTFTADSKETEIATVIGDVDNLIEYFTFEQQVGVSAHVGTPTIDATNRTVFYQDTVTLTLEKNNTETKTLMASLNAGRFSIVLLDQNGEYHLMGLRNGCTVSEGTASLGQGLGDANTIALTFIAQEPRPMASIPSSLIEMKASGADNTVNKINIVTI